MNSETKANSRGYSSRDNGEFKTPHSESKPKVLDGSADHGDDFWSKYFRDTGVRRFCSGETIDHDVPFDHLTQRLDRGFIKTTGYNHTLGLSTGQAIGNKTPEPLDTTLICKGYLFFQRHGESRHQLQSSPSVDPQLTDRGIQQADNIRYQLIQRIQSGEFQRPDLLFTSPQHRAVQTAEMSIVESLLEQGRTLPPGYTVALAREWLSVMSHACMRSFPDSDFFYPLDHSPSDPDPGLIAPPESAAERNDRARKLIDSLVHAMTHASARKITQMTKKEQDALADRGEAPKVASWLTSHGAILWAALVALPPPKDDPDWLRISQQPTFRFDNAHTARVGVTIAYDEHQEKWAVRSIDDYELGWMRVTEELRTPDGNRPRIAKEV